VHQPGRGRRGPRPGAAHAASVVHGAASRAAWSRSVRAAEPYRGDARTAGTPGAGPDGASAPAADAATRAVLRTTARFGAAGSRTVRGTRLGVRAAGRAPARVGGRPGRSAAPGRRTDQQAARGARLLAGRGSGRGRRLAAQPPRWRR